MSRTLRLVLGLWMAGLCAQLPAQENPLAVGAPDPVDLSRNTIRFLGPDPGWPELRGMVERLLLDGQGQIQIVHVGGSHVQADLWSNQMRVRLQQLAPGLRAARGFVFPHSLAGSDNSQWLAVRAQGAWGALDREVGRDTLGYGLAGRAAWTRDAAPTLELTLREDAPPPAERMGFTRVRVLHRGDSSRVVEAWSPDPAVEIHATRDSLLGVSCFQFNPEQDTLRLRVLPADSSHTRFILHGIVLETDEPGFVLHSAGVNGADTAQTLARPHLAEDLALLKPDLVVLSLGINDAHGPDFDPERFRANYEQLIARVRQAAPDCAILLTTNTDSCRKRKRPNTNGLRVREVMEGLSADQGVGLWDALGVMGGLGSIKEWRRQELAQRDLVHLSRAGYHLLGDLLATALVADLTKGLRPVEDLR